MKVLELFCCSGGMAEGFRRAGLDVTWSFDYDPDACASYEANLGHVPIRMDVRDLVRMARGGWAPAQSVDLIVADPPCTPWSRAGKRRGLADDRDMLPETCELIRLLKPRAWLIGNVPGLDDSTQADAVEATIGQLRPDYHVDYARLDAADYGVPQHRVRPFWFGHRHGTPCIAWPLPSHCEPDQLDIFGRRPWVTCRDALAHLPLEELGRPVRLRWRDGGPHRPNRPDEPARTLTRNDYGDGSVLAHPRHPVTRSDKPSHTIKTNGGRAAGASSMMTWPLSPRPCQGHRIGDLDRPGSTLTSRPAGCGAGASVVFDWPWNRPSTTVCAGTPKIAAAGEHSGHHGPNAIVLSERAATILQGFPETWKFVGRTKTSRWNQLGMAMPPPLAEAVARSVLNQLSGKTGSDGAMLEHRPAALTTPQNVAVERIEPRLPGRDHSVATLLQAGADLGNGGPPS